MSSRYYIAYGSNLNIEEMRLRCPDAELKGTAVLQGYRLLFKGEWNESWLTLAKDPDGQVPAAVWLISRKDEMMLDHYEGFPVLYFKEELQLPLVTGGSSQLKDITAFAYIMQSYVEPAIPSSSYVEECIEGYRSFGFDPDLLTQALEETRKLLNKAE